MRLNKTLGLFGVVVLVACSGSDTSAPGADPSTASVSRTSPNDPTDPTEMPEMPATDTATQSSDTRVPTGPETEPDTAALPAVGRCSAAQGHTDVSVWHSLGGYAGPDTFDGQVAEFNATHPSITLVVTWQGGSESLMAHLAETERSAWPDLVIQAPSAMKRFMTNNLTVPPGECAGQADINAGLLPVVVATYSVGGVMQAYPYGVSTPVLFFDAAAFRTAGLDPAHPPATLEQLRAASQQLVSSGTRPFGMVVTTWYASMVINQWSAQRGDLVASPANGRNGDGVTVDFVTPDNEAAMQWLSDLVATGDGQFIGGNNSTYDDLIQVGTPTSGGAMAVHTSGSLGDVIQFVESGSFPGIEVGIGPMPGPGVGALIGGNALWLIDNGDPSRVGAANDVAMWLVRPEHLGPLDAVTGYVPPSEIVADDPSVHRAWAVHPQFRVAYDQLVSTPGSDATAGALYGPDKEIERLLFAATEALVSGTTTAHETLVQLTSQANELIAVFEKVNAAG